MIGEPLSFDEAIRFLTEKEGKPASWSAASWAEKKPEVRTRAFWSARVENARFITRAQDFLGAYMAREIEQVVGPDGVVRPALKTGSRDQFVARMTEFMLQEGMVRKGELRSVNQKDVRDIRSLARLRLIFDTNTRQAYGYGQWKQGTEPAALYAFPAARLIRDRGVKEPRPRHQANLGEVLLKTDPRWAQFHNDPAIGGFGVPWGPFGFNSGCTQEDVSRAEAKALGLPVDSIKPPEEDLNSNLSSSTRGMDSRTRAKLAAELRGGPKAKDPKEAAKDAARLARREMLDRGLAKALDQGQADRVRRYRRELARMAREEGLEIEEKGDRIALALPKKKARPFSAAEEILDTLPAEPIRKAAKIRKAFDDGKISERVAINRLRRIQGIPEHLARAILERLQE